MSVFLCRSKRESDFRINEIKIVQYVTFNLIYCPSFFGTFYVSKFIFQNILNSLLFSPIQFASEIHSKRYLIPSMSVFLCVQIVDAIFNGDVMLIYAVYL